MNTSQRLLQTWLIVDIHLAIGIEKLCICCMKTLPVQSFYEKLIQFMWKPNHRLMKTKPMFDEHLAVVWQNTIQFVMET